jgi:hypothetical protein
MRKKLTLVLNLYEPQGLSMKISGMDQKSEYRLARYRLSQVPMWVEQQLSYLLTALSRIPINPQHHKPSLKKKPFQKVHIDTKCAFIVQSINYSHPEDQDD